VAIARSAEVTVSDSESGLPSRPFPGSASTGATRSWFRHRLLHKSDHLCSFRSCASRGPAARLTGT
jgi:hypothetical protein